MRQLGPVGRDGHEGATFWLQVLTELKNRGLQGSFTGVLPCTRTQSQAQPLQQKLQQQTRDLAVFRCGSCRTCLPVPRRYAPYIEEIVLNALPHKQVSLPDNAG